MKYVKNRNGKLVPEIHREVCRKYKGVDIEYSEFFYFDCKVNDETGVIDKTKLEQFYTLEQVKRNLSNFKQAYKKALINK